MRAVLVALWAAMLVAAAGAETLALTIRYENTVPGEVRTAWTKEYYTDDQGRLVRVHRVTEAAEVGGTPGVEDQVFRWQAGRVDWERSHGGYTDRQSLEVTTAGLQHAYRSEKDGSSAPVGFTELIRLVSPDPLEWEDGLYHHRWSAEGYSRTALSPPSREGSPDLEYVTQGARFTELYKGHENLTMVANKSPGRLVFTIVTENESSPGWSTTGEIRLTGVGLALPDPLLSLAQFYLVQEPAAAGFLFEKRYLK